MKQEMIQKSKTEEENRKALIDKFQGSLEEITKSLGNNHLTAYAKNGGVLSTSTFLQNFYSEKNSEFNSTLKQDNDRLRNEV